MNGDARRWAALGLVSLLLVGFTVRSLRSKPVEEAALETPTAAELDSLGRYLAPAARTSNLEDYAVFLPGPRPVNVAPPAEGGPDAEPDASAWRLSAILIAGPRPVAIINDEAIPAGGALDDGAQLLIIERDHVVIRAPNGARHRLTLTAG